MLLKRKFIWSILVLIMLGLVGGSIWLWLRSGSYGFHVVFRRGGTYWITVRADDVRLSPAMKLALSSPEPTASAGALQWREPETGFAVAELPVLVGTKEVDKILLNRIDPAHFRFVVHNSPDGDKGIEDWERALPDAALIVNGSYYDLKGKPDTPFVSEGVALGPRHYNAKAGAFVARDDRVEIEDLSSKDWQRAFDGARNAMVSYPLLIGQDGNTHVTTTSRWLANRSFVGKDSNGRIIIGTTQDAFFTLAQLAKFLKNAPLDLQLALNLDGGPIACQSVRIKDFHRIFHAKWEAQVSGDQVRLLRWPFTQATWAMPVVLTVERR